MLRIVRKLTWGTRQTGYHPAPAVPPEWISKQGGTVGEEEQNGDEFYFLVVHRRFCFFSFVGYQIVMIRDLVPALLFDSRILLYHARGRFSDRAVWTPIFRHHN